MLERQWDDESFGPYRRAFPSEHGATKADFQAHFEDLVRRDVKAPYVKQLQGFLWREGYASGELRVSLFPDVHPLLRKWHDRGIGILIYSSGSVEAQKLLFANTDGEPADLSPLISGWFDTVNAGPKTEPASYERICATRPEVPPGEWLFLSDNIREVDAAEAAGLQALIVNRPGNAALPGDLEPGRVIESFVECDPFPTN